MLNNNRLSQRIYIALNFRVKQKYNLFDYLKHQLERNYLEHQLERTLVAL
jgi:hypothetical protein